MPTQQFRDPSRSERLDIESHNRALRALEIRRLNNEQARINNDPNRGEQAVQRQERATQQRGRQQKLDFQWEQIQKWAADPRNSVTEAEFNQVRQKYTNNSQMTGDVNPIQLRTVSEEADNPLLQATNMASGLAEQYDGYTADQMQHLIAKDPEGRPLPGAGLAARKYLDDRDFKNRTLDQKQRIPNIQHRAAVKNRLAQIDKQIVDMAKRSPDFYDEYGQPLPTRVESDYWTEAGAREAIDAQSVETQARDILVKERSTLQAQEARFLQELNDAYGRGTTAQTPPPVLTQTPPPVLTPAPAAGGPTRFQLPNLDYTDTSPFAVPGGQDLGAVMKAANERAKSTGKSVTVHDPQSGKAWRFLPK